MPSTLETPTRAVKDPASTLSRTEEKLDRYMKLNYAIELIEEDGQYTASYPELKGCISFGDSPNEAVSELRGVKELWLRGQIESGNSIPEPANLEDFSGKFVLRLPKSLHRSLHLEAEQQGVSLNQYINFRLAERHASRVDSVDYQKLSDQLLSLVHSLSFAKHRYDAAYGYMGAATFHINIPGSFHRLQDLTHLQKDLTLVRYTENIGATASKQQYREVHGE